jgi:hypothetical protein
MMHFLESAAFVGGVLHARTHPPPGSPRPMNHPESPVAMHRIALLSFEAFATAGDLSRGLPGRLPLPDPC